MWLKFLLWLKGSRKFVTYPVLAFIILFTLFLICEQANARVTVGLGQGVNNAESLTTQRVGWTNDRWYARGERLGGEDYNDTWSVAAGRRVAVTDWRVRPFMELGVILFEEELQYQGRPLVSEEYMFELVAGATWRLSNVSDIELSWVHNSTAGRSDINDGIDRVYLGYTWSF